MEKRCKYCKNWTDKWYCACSGKTTGADTKCSCGKFKHLDWNFVYSLAKCNPVMLGVYDKDKYSELR